jgi:hypothetical protein
VKSRVIEHREADGSLGFFALLLEFRLQAAHFG